MKHFSNLEPPSRDFVALLLRCLPAPPFLIFFRCCCDEVFVLCFVVSFPPSERFLLEVLKVLEVLEVLEEVEEVEEAEEEKRRGLDFLLPSLPLSSLPLSLSSTT